MAETTPRAIRVPEDLWRAALVKARDEGTTVTAVVLAALRAFTGSPVPTESSRPPRAPTR